MKMHFFLLALSPILVCGNLKEDIASLEKKVCEDSTLYVELAIAYVQDQEIDKAFRAFVKALENIQFEKDAPLVEDEKAIYQQALDSYLKSRSNDPYKSAQELLSHCETIAIKHPEYAYLNFLVATAYGNIGEYEKFFTSFYHYYPKMGNNFLADKTLAMLYFKIASGEKEEREKERFKTTATRHLKDALQKNSHDPSIYKILILSAKERGNQEEEIGYFKLMCQQANVVMRSDIFLYIKELVDLKQISLAEELLKNIASTYAYSRLIEEAQEYINRAKA